MRKSTLKRAREAVRRQQNLEKTKELLMRSTLGLINDEPLPPPMDTPRSKKRA